MKNYKGLSKYKYVREGNITGRNLKYYHNKVEASTNNTTKKHKQKKMESKKIKVDVVEQGLEEKPQPMEVDEPVITSLLHETCNFLSVNEQDFRILVICTEVR